MLSVETFKMTNKLKYSYDNGYEWNEFQFATNENVLVEQVLTNSMEFASAFYLICSNNANQRIIFKIDFKQMTSEQIEDMKMNKLSETTTGSTLLDLLIKKETTT